ncbi:hypothetical protein BJN34_01375 [Cupriavidus necator]|uniref:Uncharacterized protein n=1 Tax=Cupriavidus necator TaxID=106590 RepID=A0A1U9UIQ5_CUPNE|nr:hypothetical protein [Cupriavidus necator]AQV92544.1 hypothetical protein BJN34_01375 [Cupriavidus necator]
MKLTPELGPLLDEATPADNREPEANGRFGEQQACKTRVILYISRQHLDNIFASAGLGKFKQKKDGGFQVSLTAVIAYRQARYIG